MILDRELALDLLNQLVERLADQEVHVHIHVVGGAALMLTVRPDRDATVDIDSWINAAAGSRDRVAVDEAVFEIARGHPGLPDNWLNDGARLFIPDSVSGLDDDWIPLIERGSVKVSVARPEVLLVMKLLAGRGRRDLPDLPSLIEACGLRTRAEIEHAFERWYPDDAMGPPAVVWLDKHYPLD